jgi:uncharacterized phage-associated protein
MWYTGFFEIQKWPLGREKPVSFDPKAIANHLIEVAKTCNERLTPMKLQKLVFYAHGWHLALVNKPLVDGGVQAWKYGPVITSLYHEFKDCGNQEISRKAEDVRYVEGPRGIRAEHYEPSIDEYSEVDEKAIAKAILERIYSVYGKYDGMQLSGMTHREGTPWWVISKAHQGEIPKGLKIPDETIKEFFQRQLLPKTPQ